MEDYTDKLRALQNTAKELLPQIYHHCHSLPTGGLYDPVLAVAKKHPELTAKLVKKVGLQHPRHVVLDKVDKPGVDLLRDTAEEIRSCLAPLYGLLEDIAIFHEHTVRVLTDVSQSLLPFSLSYTPEILEAFMGLFVAACRVHMLAVKMPRPLILQMYAYAYDQVYSLDPPHYAEVANFVHYFQDVIPQLQAEFQPVSMRIGEVLEKIVAPGLKKYSQVRYLSTSKLFALDPQPVSVAKGEKQDFPVSIGHQQYTAIQRIDKLRNWVILGLLVCPGETARNEVCELLSLICKDTFRFIIYRNHVEWLHPLFEQHVVPLMISTAKKGHLTWGEKRDMKRTVEKAFSHACENAMYDHEMRRTWLTHKLQEVATCVEEEPELILNNYDMVMALLAMSRLEIEWIMLHANESLPKFMPLSWSKTSFPLGHAKSSFPDLKVACLMSAHEHMLHILRQHGKAVRAYSAWLLWNRLQTFVKPMYHQIASAPTLTRHHQPVLTTIDTLLSKYSQISKALLQRLAVDSHDKPHFANQFNDSSGQLEEIQDLFQAVKSVWLTLNAQLFSTKTNVTGQSLDALASRENPLNESKQVNSPNKELSSLGGDAGGAAGAASFIQLLNEMSEVCWTAVNLKEKLQRVSSLRAICFQLPKMQALFLGAMSGPANVARHVMAFLPVLSSSCENDHTNLCEDHGKAAAALADHLLGAAVTHLRGMMHRLYTSAFSAQREPVSMQDIDSTQRAVSAQEAGSVAASVGLHGATLSKFGSSSLSGSIMTPLSAVVKSGKDFISSISAIDTPMSGQDVPIKVNLACDPQAVVLLENVLALVQAFSTQEPYGFIAVSSQEAFVLQEWFQEAIVSSFRTFLRQSAWNGKTIQRPSLLERQVNRFFDMLNVIQDHTRLDIGMIVREVLTGQTYCPPRNTSAAKAASTSAFSPAGPNRQPGTVSSNKSVGQIADWLVTYVVRDKSEAGVAYSTKKMSFFTRGSQRFQQQMKSATAGPPLDASQYASMSELQALFRLYGPFAALELDRKSEPVLRECILSVHAVLKANQDILMRVCKRAQFPASCKKLLEEVCELRRLQPALKNLGQALFFRELCACACGAETRNNLPHVVGQIDCLDAETANSGSYNDGVSWQHAGSILKRDVGLAGKTFLCRTAMSASDPVLVDYLKSMPVEDVSLWRMLPLLTALMVRAFDWSSVAWIPSWETLSHDMHCVPHVINCVAHALGEVPSANQTSASHASSKANALNQSNEKGSILGEFMDFLTNFVLPEGSPRQAQIMLMGEVAGLQQALGHFGSHLSTALYSACARSSYSQSHSGL